MNNILNISDNLGYEDKINRNIKKRENYLFKVIMNPVIKNEPCFDRGVNIRLLEYSMYNEAYFSTYKEAKAFKNAIRLVRNDIKSYVIVARI